LAGRTPSPGRDPGEGDPHWQETFEKGTIVDFIARRLRTPEERVGMLPNVSLPPPKDHGTGASDEELLLSALRDRNEDAMSLVLDRLHPAMLRVARMYVMNHATAEEAVQETWLAAISGIDRFEGRSSLKTWLFHILKNIARSRGKRDARMVSFTDTACTEPLQSGDPIERIGQGAQQPLWTHGTDPEAELLAAEMARRLERAIEALSARYREVLVLRDVEGWSSEDVCNILGISQTNQRVILHRARDRVRHDLQNYLADTDDCEAREIMS
jgi:RNA polymerase sigma-70 factor (ECF subfamily)